MSEGCLRDWKLDVAVRDRRCNLTRWNRTDGTVQPPITSASRIAAQRPNSVTGRLASTPRITVLVRDEARGVGE